MGSEGSEAPINSIMPRSLLQTMTICQVKLSNGLFVQGPQCPSENEAQERAAFSALQQLVRALESPCPPWAPRDFYCCLLIAFPLQGPFGMNFPMPPPIFPAPGYPAAPPGTLPPVFPPPTGKSVLLKIVTTFRNFLKP